jgi:anti-sigma regulatory factor (Ser/Thr protein kinase)
METVLTATARQTIFRIEEVSQVASVRRAGSELAQMLGFDETMTGRVALVITEAATNIVKHAVRGDMLLRAVTHGGTFGVEIIAIDSGPGMRNLAFHMQDGNSTAGSYGAGLGVMRRQSSEFDIYTVPNGGTALCSIVWSGPNIDHSKRRKVGVVCLPLAGEEVCGDAWAVVESADCLSVLVADGLGHGPEAARASRAAVSAVEQHPNTMPGELIQLIHGALRSTRGAAVGLARLDFHTEELHFVGVGNVAAAVHEADARHHLVSFNGIVGSNMQKLKVFTVAWTENMRLIMHSDGIGTSWDLKQYPGLLACHPSVIAAVLYRDFARLRDDVTVLVVAQR